MFQLSDYHFMANKMKIDVSSIESKISEPFFIEYKLIAIEAIRVFIESIKEFEASGKKRDLYSGVDNEAEDKITSYVCGILDNVEDEKAYQVIDALRHTFSCYAYNGLHQLYTRQENESWHPKIVLSEVLTPNDISSLDQELTLYRGCDVSEYENKAFGQAWTTSLKVANDFAFVDYQSQDWFDKDSRVVLEATYRRENVLFSDQSIEFEVVVDVRKLKHVHIHT